VFHASLDPHASILLRDEKVLGWGAGGFDFETGAGAGLERLNAGLAVYDSILIGAGLDDGAGAGAGAGAGVGSGFDAKPDEEEPNRSPIVELGGGAR